MTDKLPPQAVEIEETILGLVLTTPEAFGTISHIITDKCFYVPKNGLIWQSCKRLADAKEAIDIVTVAQRLKKDGYINDIGGLVYLSEVSNKATYSTPIDFCARLLVQKYVQREIINISTQLSFRAFEDTADIFELQEAIKKLYDFTLNHTTSGREAVHIVEALKADLEAYDRRSKAKITGGVTGISYGLKELNRMTMGSQDSTLIILAARPGMGKTALAMHIARYCGVPVQFFSIEMSEAQLTQRLVITESEIDGYDYKAGRLSEQQAIEVERARGRLEQIQLYIDDQTPITITEMKARCMKFRRKHPDKMLIIVDYLQLVKPDNEKGKNREQQIAEVSRGLKEISKVCNCPVIALAQLSRMVEQRGGSKKPQLSDLRESGQIEQDADVVLFIHRDEYYGVMQDATGNSTKGKAEIIIAKHRDGSTGVVDVGFRDDITKFHDFTTESGIMQPNTNFLDSPF